MDYKNAFTLLITLKSKVPIKAFLFSTMLTTSFLTPSVFAVDSSEEDEGPVAPVVVVSGSKTLDDTLARLSERDTSSASAAIQVMDEAEAEVSLIQAKLSPELLTRVFHHLFRSYGNDGFHSEFDVGSWYAVVRTSRSWCRWANASVFLRPVLFHRILKQLQSNPGWEEDLEGDYPLERRDETSHIYSAFLAIEYKHLYDPLKQAMRSLPIPVLQHSFFKGQMDLIANHPMYGVTNSGEGLDSEDILDVFSIFLSLFEGVPQDQMVPLCDALNQYGIPLSEGVDAEDRSLLLRALSRQGHANVGAFCQALQPHLADLRECVRRDGDYYDYESGQDTSGFVPLIEGITRHPAIEVAPLCSLLKDSVIPFISRTAFSKYSHEFGLLLGYVLSRSEEEIRPLCSELSEQTDIPLDGRHLGYILAGARLCPAQEVALLCSALSEYTIPHLGSLFGSSILRAIASVHSSEKVQPVCAVLRQCVDDNVFPTQLSEVQISRILQGLSMQQEEQILPVVEFLQPIFQMVAAENPEQGEIEENSFNERLYARGQMLSHLTSLPMEELNEISDQVSTIETPYLKLFEITRLAEAYAKSRHPFGFDWEDMCDFYQI